MRTDNTPLDNNGNPQALDSLTDTQDALLVTQQSAHEVHEQVQEPLLEHWLKPDELYSDSIEDALRYSGTSRAINYVSTPLYVIAAGLMLSGVGGAVGVLIAAIASHISAVFGFSMESDEPAFTALGFMPGPVARALISPFHTWAARENHERYRYHDAAQVRQEVLDMIESSNDDALQAKISEIIDAYRQLKRIRSNWFQSTRTKSALDLLKSPYATLNEKKNRLKWIVTHNHGEGSALFTAILETCSTTLQHQSRAHHLVTYLNTLPSEQAHRDGLFQAIAETYRTKKGWVKSQLTLFTQSDASQQLLATLTHARASSQEKLARVIDYLKKPHNHQSTLFRVIFEAVSELRQAPHAQAIDDNNNPITSGLRTPLLEH